jgi:dTMP kinase
MDIEAEHAGTRLRRRQTETGTSGDIHEKDVIYLNNCAQSGRQAAIQYGWFIISCMSNGRESTEAEIHREIYDRIFGASGRM